ncbi:MAG: ketose-bisphosphate aldolase [Spirochaetes bacterium]|nr:ketose-bisphosphate aldolase [Spirochaetota bacterium]
MPLMDLNTVLLPAYRGKYAVGAFNVINIEFLHAIFAAAENKKAPVIINIAEVHLPFMDIELICAAVRHAALKSGINAVLNFDHGLSFESIAKTLPLGFTSVMIDGSLLSFDENIRVTGEIVKMCHAAGVSVEAELGAVGGSEDGSLESEADPALYTDASLAGEFVKKTGIDALAVAIGNSHGRYKGAPVLDFKRLAEIKEAAGIPLVLHGGSGISEEGFRTAINNGISKINFFTGMAQTAMNVLSEKFSMSSSGYNDFPAMMKEVSTRVQKTVEEQIDIFLNRK